MTDPPGLPDGFAVGHWSDKHARTGCTVVLAPPGTRGGVEIRGGGTGTRELEPLQPLANAEGPNAVLMTGGSAFGLAAADGAMRWLEERGIGRPTPLGPIPLVATAVVFDLPEGDRRVRPGPDAGYAACEAATGGVPQRGRVGAGSGVAVGKLLGRELATPSGVGYAAATVGDGVRVSVIVIANAFGDVIEADGSVLGGPRGAGGELQRSAELIAAGSGPIDAGLRPGEEQPRPDEEQPRPDEEQPRAGESTTLACICTDASIDKRGCGIVARIASAGLARACDPVFTPLDGDVVFCLASGSGPPPAAGLPATAAVTVLGTVAATLVAAAIRDAVRQASA